MAQSVAGPYNGKDRLTLGTTSKTETRESNKKYGPKRDSKGPTTSKDQTEEDPVDTKEKEEILSLVMESSTEQLQTLLKDGGASLDEGISDNGEEGVHSSSQESRKQSLNLPPC